MICRRTINFLITFILFDSLVYAQATDSRKDSMNQLENKTYERVKITFKNNDRIMVSKLRCIGDKVSYRLNENSEFLDININEVAVIRVYQGTEAGKWAIIGGLATGGAAALSLAILSSDETSGTIPSAPWIVGWTLAGGLLGAILGGNQEKWNTIYFVEKTAFIESIGPYLSYCRKNKSFNLHVLVSF